MFIQYIGVNCCFIFRISSTAPMYFDSFIFAT